MKRHPNYIPAALSLGVIALAGATVTPSYADHHKTQKSKAGAHASADNKSEAMRSSSMRSEQGQAKLELASKDSERNSLDAFMGKEIRGANGEKVGKVKDFIVDTKSGKIALAVVASGGLAGIGETLRIVPVHALQRASGDEGFTTPVRKENWDKLPAISKDAFEEGSIRLAEEQRRLLASREYGEADPELMASLEDDVADSQQGGAYRPRMMRAEKIVDRDVVSGNEEVGEIEAIILNFDQRTATALVETESDFIGSDRKFLVPLQDLQIMRGHDDDKNVKTTLTRADFERAGMIVATAATASSAANQIERNVERAGREVERTAERTARNVERTAERAERNLEREADQARAKAAARTDRLEASAADRSAASAGTATTGAVVATENRGKEELAPTGRTDSDQTHGGYATLQSAARSVRQVWDAHPNLAKADLSVSVKNNKLLLQGAVPSEELRERAKDIAESVLAGIDFENEIKVKQQ